jgi:hypothetical protein
VSHPKFTAIVGVFLLLAAAAAGRAQDIVRIGVVKPKVQAVAGDSAQIADAVRNTLAEYLGGPSQEVLLLEARARGQVMQEAQLAGCDYVLFATLSHRRGGAGSGAFGRALNRVAGAAQSGYVPTDSPLTTVAVSTALETAGDYASVMQARDELRLEYVVESIAGQAPLLQEEQKLKAESDGQDLLTPLVEGAAESIAEALRQSAE